jgi:hypothetical protein
MKRKICLHRVNARMRPFTAVGFLSPHLFVALAMKLP